MADSSLASSEAGPAPLLLVEDLPHRLNLPNAEVERPAVSRYEATYTDIVEHVRIVTTYDMWLDGVHMSTSVASVEFKPIDQGTRFTHVEHGVFLDQFWADAPNREKGSRGLLEALGNILV